MADKATELIHHSYQAPTGFASVQPAVFKASTVIFPNVAAMRTRDWKRRDGYTYGLHGTPTTFLLESRLATLEGGHHCLLAPSGLAAIANVNLALLHQGDEVLLPANVYGPSKAMAEGELKQWGITHKFYNPLDASDLAAKIGPNTRLVWLEAPGSVTMEFPDLIALTSLCRQRGVISALDNTWGAGLAFAPFDLAPGVGVDISVHALTKYPSGGGDLLMGSVITCDEALHHRLKLSHMRLGIGVAANDAEGVLRGLPSLPLRYAAQDKVGRELALWLGVRDEIEQVLHPAIAGSPGHENWRKTCAASGAAAGIFSVVFHARYSTQQVDRFCDSLKLFKLGYSWAGPLSLVVPYDVPSMRDASVAPWPYKGTLVRFCIGLESRQALQEDIEQALTATHG